MAVTDETMDKLVNELFDRMDRNSSMRHSIRRGIELGLEVQRAVSEQELVDARREASCCDDIKLNQPLSGIIADLNASRSEVCNPEKLATDIVQSVCEMTDIPDPDGDDTLIVTTSDLQAIIVNHLTDYGARALSLPVSNTGEWLDIETAPKDVDVLLAWESSDEKWEMEVGWAGHENKHKGGYSDGWMHGEATHWRPLPEAPK